MYVKWLNSIEDCLVRYLVEEIVDEEKIKACLSCLVTIKDDLAELIPDKKQEEDEQ
jgi:hypothetical protein